jgi:Flp pilus assembly pilin Flp
MTMPVGWRQRDRGFGRFLRACGGATSVEYGLIAVLVAVGTLVG